MSRTTKKKTRSKKQLISEAEHWYWAQVEQNLILSQLIKSMLKTKKIDLAYEKKFGKSKGIEVHICKPHAKLLKKKYKIKDYNAL